MSNLQINSLTPRTEPNINIQGINPPTFNSLPLATQFWTTGQIDALNGSNIESGGDPGGRFPGSNTLMDQIQAIGDGLAASMPFSPAGATTFIQLMKGFYRAACPIGKVIYGYWTSAPPGTLLLNGGVYGRTSYPELFAWIVANNLYSGLLADQTTAQRAMFSLGDGTTTFSVPNLSNLFLRVRDVTGTPRAPGNIEDQMVLKHKHAGGGTGENLAVSAGAPFGHTTAQTYAGGNLGTTDNDNTIWYTNDGTNLVGEDPMNPAGLMGTENRPTNVAVSAAIYF